MPVRHLAHVAAVLLLVAASCLGQVPDYADTRFQCAPPEELCPSGFTCAAGWCVKSSPDAPDVSSGGDDLVIVDGYDLKTEQPLAQAPLVLDALRKSDDRRYAIDPGFATSYAFEAVPAAASAAIRSVRIAIEHYEENGFEGPLEWQVATGAPAALLDPGAPMLGSQTPTLLLGPASEGEAWWDVTALFPTAAELSGLLFVIRNGDKATKKAYLDRIALHVDYAK